MDDCRLSHQTSAFHSFHVGQSTKALAEMCMHELVRLHGILVSIILD